jgi:cytochrome c oxidase subunit II
MALADRSPAPTRDAEEPRDELMRVNAARAWPRTALRAGIPLLLIAVLGGCGMIPPEPKTEAAKSVFTLYNIVFAMGVLVFLGVEGFIVYSIFRYRRRDDLLPAQTHGNTIIEIIWTAIPTVIVFILFIASVTTLATVEATSESNKGIDIEVDGFQWQWQFRYMDGDDNPENDVSVIGQPPNPPVMVVPVGEPVRLTLLTRDVIHSFYVPHFLIKRDLIPVPEGDTPNHLAFTVSEAGTYAGQCAEFCGQLHARMTFVVQAMPRAEFDRWLADAKAGRTPRPSVQPGGEVLELVADNIAYDKLELSAAADTPLTLRFDNRDDGVPHDVVIQDSNGQEKFRTDPLTGPDSGEFQVPALPAGEYTYFCSFHPGVPAMTGTLTVE